MPDTISKFPRRVPTASLMVRRHYRQDPSGFLRATARVAILSAIVLSSISGPLRGAAAPPTLKVGDQAPPFSLVGSDGRTYQLADFRGKQVVVLAWFAKAFTSG